MDPTRFAIHKLGSSRPIETYTIDTSVVSEFPKETTSKSTNDKARALRVNPRFEGRFRMMQDKNDNSPDRNRNNRIPLMPKSTSMPSW